MNKPSVLQVVQRGKIWCSAVFEHLVETWNWLVFAFDALKGDYDVNPKDGYITVDKTDPSHPVVRLARPLPSGGTPSPSPTPSGGGSSGGFAYSNGTIAGGAACIARQYIQVDPLTNAGDGEYRVKIDMLNRSAVIEAGSGFEAPTAAFTYVPLFVISGGAISVDYRGAAMAQAWEDYEDVSVES